MWETVEGGNKPSSESPAFSHLIAQEHLSWLSVFPPSPKLEYDM